MFNQDTFLANVFTHGLQTNAFPHYVLLSVYSSYTSWEMLSEIRYIRMDLYQYEHLNVYPKPVFQQMSSGMH